jgi:hypothetical protein
VKVATPTGVRSRIGCLTADGLRFSPATNFRPMTSPRDTTSPNLLLRILDTSLGTLWWVREDTLIAAHQRLGHDYVDSDRRGHPTLSIARHSLLAAYHAVPMLQGGSTQHSGAFAVHNLTPDRKSSYFSALCPVLIQGHEFLSPAPDHKRTTDRSSAEGPWWQRSTVTANWHKLKLSETESEHLRRWLANKGISVT